jgi:hypothetical protein
MIDRWRLGLVERSVLEAMDDLGASGPDRPYIKCSRFVQFLADERAITPRYGFDALCTLSQPWLLHIPLVDFHGNNGCLDDVPAPAQMTEARLSAPGRMALAAERGAGPLVPLALINGDLFADGDAPPFAPNRVLDAPFALLHNPQLSAAGVSYRRLDASGVEELIGKGVFYSPAVTEAAAMTDRPVVVVGGGTRPGKPPSIYRSTPRRSRCWCGASRWRRACRIT